ncbi:MAG: gamma-glutamyltransferase family protein [Rhodobacteraceae bacterium]|nr:gamma-glutamyltransferase family protein [Paracoccaceae bacterium]
MRDFHLPGRSPALATNGMCATSHPLGSLVAIQTLQAGGNAMDAAIAGAVVLGLCEPQMTGLGGDCFALVSPAGSDEVISVNGSGEAPAAATAEALREQGHKDIPLQSAAAVTLPGAVDAFCAMSDRWGQIGLEKLLAPAIHYAEAGVPVAPRVAMDWADDAGNLQGKAREWFLDDGVAPKVGTLHRHKGVAEVLRRIAAQGRDAFYTGEVAEDMHAALTAAGGVHTLEDFANVSHLTGTPLSGNYHNKELLEHPPNGQGAAAILLLNMLKHFDIAGMDPFGAERAHIETECAKLAYDARNRFVADPDHAAKIAHMLAPETAERLAALVDPNRAMPCATVISEAVHRDTVYITVVDRNRMAVSLIYSIFHSFGSGIASDKFGILMHNRGAGFTLQPGHPNELHGGKRPMHTIIPGMLRANGRLVMPFGVMGGQYQSHGHARFLSNITDFGMDPQSAIDAPRCFYEAGDTRLERGYSDATRQALVEKGHHVVTPGTAIGGAQAIQIHESGVLEGASDPRKDGCALGY